MSKLVFDGETLITLIELNNKGYQDSSAVASAIETAVAGLATDASVEAAIAIAVTGLASDASVEAAIASATEGIATDASVEAAIETAVAGLATDASVASAIASATAGFQTAAQVNTIATDKANEAVNGIIGVDGEVIVNADVFIPVKDAVPTVKADYTSGTPAVRFIKNAGVKNNTQRPMHQGISYTLLKNVTSAQEYTVNLGSANYVDKPITVRSDCYSIFILGWSDENHTQVICGGSYNKPAGAGPEAFCYKLNSDETDIVSINTGDDNTKPTVSLTPNFTTGDKVWDKWYPLLKPKTGINISWNATITNGSTVVKIYDVIVAIGYVFESGMSISSSSMMADRTLNNVFSNSGYFRKYFDALCPVDMKGYSFSDNQLVTYREYLDSYKEEMDEKLSKLIDVTLYDGKESIADPSISFVTYNNPFNDSGRTKLADHVANDASIAVVTVKWEDPYEDIYGNIVSERPYVFRSFDSHNSYYGTLWYANDLNDLSPDALLKIDGWNYAINCHIPVEDPNHAGFYSYAGSYPYYKNSNTLTQPQYHIGEIAITTKNEYDVLVQTVESITNAGYQTASDVSTAISTAMSSALHMVTLTQQEYDELQVKAPNTLYIISD